MNWVRKWSRVALLYFVLAASFGILLRYLQTSFIGGLNYKFLLHTHSHIALLGWVYIALILAIVNSIRFSEPNLNNAGFRRILWFTNITVVGMMISFPVQGYGVVSITFSTLFLFASYWFVGWFFANVKSKPLTIGAKFIRSGLIYLVISSFGPWALGPIMVIGESHSDWYYMAIYFYLHFLYNGFFVMSIFGLVRNRLSTVERQEGICLHQHIHCACFHFISIMDATKHSVICSWWRCRHLTNYSLFDLLPCTEDFYEINYKQQLGENSIFYSLLFICHKNFTPGNFKPSYCGRLYL